jgi:hypothetical protein
MYEKRRQNMSSAATTSPKTPDIGTIMAQGQQMQDTMLRLNEYTQKMNMRNMMIQGQHNLFNAGIQALSKACASARDAFSAIGQNM